MITNLEHHSPLNKSDHQVLTWTVGCYTEATTSTKPRLQWPKANFNGMRQELDTHRWTFSDGVNTDTPVNELWDEIKGKIMELSDKFVPSTTANSRVSWDDKDFPASEDLRNLIKEKNRAHRAWKRRVK